MGPTESAAVRRRARARRRLPAWLQGHLESPDVAHVIYGAIVGMALVIALQFDPPTAAEVVAALAGTAAAIGLAEGYSELIAGQARTRRHITASDVRRTARGALAVAFGTAFPAIFFVLAAARVIELNTAFTLSKWTGLGLICGYGFLAARLAGTSVTRALFHAAAVGAIAGALIAFKALLH